MNLYPHPMAAKAENPIPSRLFYIITITAPTLCRNIKKIKVRNKGTPQPTPKKSASFTYSGKQARRITNLFKNSGMQIPIELTIVYTSTDTYGTESPNW
jgi:hypothetical protein